MVVTEAQKRAAQARLKELQSGGKSVKDVARGLTGSSSPQPQSQSTQKQVTVKSGDTLSGIAQREGVSLSDISGFRSGNQNLIYPGEVLSIGKPISQEVLPQSTPDITPPSPNAPGIQESYMGSIQGNVDKYRKELETFLGDRRTEVDRELEEFRAEQKQLLSEAKPLTDPFREKLENKERERLYINENFEANQKLVGELEGLLTEGNTLIEQMKGVTGLAGIRNPRINQAIEGVAARTGVIEAVINARNGQIAQAQTLIDRSVAAITADRNDRLSYYNTLLDLNEKNIIRLEGDQKDILNKEVGLIESDLANAQAYADAIKEAMLDPEMATAYARAGVTLNDSPDQIAEKLAADSYAQEISSYSNELATEGYKFLAGGQPAPGNAEVITITDSKGKERQYYKEGSVLSSETVGGFEILRDSKGNIISSRVSSGNSGPGLTGGFFDPDSGEELSAFDAARAIVKANPDASEIELKNSIRENVTDSKGKPILGSTEISDIIEEEKSNRPAPSMDQIKTKIVDTLTPQKEALSRSEAKNTATTQLKKALGIKDGGLPKAYEDAIEDALVDVYGRTFWQKVLPGGR